MGRSARSTSEAVKKTSSLEQARAAAGAKGVEGPGGADPVVGELRRKGLLHLLVLHLVSDGRSYGNYLIDQISDMTGGWMSVNPNTMYPLLRQLESKGLIKGEWEHPERRSRRFYKITEKGEEERAKLVEEFIPLLQMISRGVEKIRVTLTGDSKESDT